MSCKASVPVSIKKVLSGDYKGEFCIIEDILESSRKTQRAYTPCKKKKYNQYVCKNHVAQESNMYFAIIIKKNIYVQKKEMYNTIPSYHQPLQCFITPELQEKVQHYLQK